MKEVVKKEILKWLSAGIVYPISDSSWVSPVQCVPKKGGITVVANTQNELVPTRTVTGWRICMDYRKLNTATRKDHFPLPFIDQMLDKLAGQEFFCFLDGYSGYNQIVIAPEDQEKTTFTCPYGTFAFKRMPFGLCNAPATFQRCMMAIFADMIEKTIEVFMDDFSVFGDSFDCCLDNLAAVLQRCEETNLVLNWEKCHFMVQEGIVLGHRVSKQGLEVDKAKVSVIEQLPPPTSVKGIRSFLGHAGFYRRFIKDFSKITKPLCNLLEKDREFKFDDACMNSFEELKKKLTSAPILVAPNWELPFIIMADASDFAVGAVLGQKVEKVFHPIYYASKTLDDAQLNYTTTEKELLAVVFAYLVNYLVCGTLPLDLNSHQKRKFLHDAKMYFWEEPYLFKRCADQMIRRCVSEVEQQDILECCHSSAYGGHFRGEKTAAKVLQSGFYWPSLFKDAYAFVIRCDRCQRVGNISRRNEMPLNNILEVELFDVWGIDFMGPFPKSLNQEYILVAVDYVSKWVEATACVSSDAKTVIKFLKKNIFTRFGAPRAIISDGGSHFCNHQFQALMKKYGVKHRVTLAYHPQSNGQAEISNREIKSILEKVVGATRKDCMSSAVELEHGAYWAIKKLNFDFQAAGAKRLLQLNELEEFRLNAYESARLYKERTKKYHDQKIIPKVFEAGQKVLLHNSKLRLFPGKLKSRWSGPFTVVQAANHGAVELENEKGERFHANGHRLKHYWGGKVDRQAFWFIPQTLELSRSGAAAHLIRSRGASSVSKCPFCNRRRGPCVNPPRRLRPWLSVPSVKTAAAFGHRRRGSLT
ncbi:uncharacterized protein LOC114754863 [Neltuma alba]|uniref:uncharacterized protein LOC114754863 n=1 Tax=Neltuma alba TaxID=207710 RepID=UPI0010A33C71|nr:uncharacterized protein LOC114754863 [Prosopis alba]